MSAIHRRWGALCLQRRLRSPMQMQRTKDAKDEAGVNVRVIVRCRPPVPQEMGSPQVIDCMPATREIAIKKNGIPLKSYTFDGVCNQNSTQERIFKNYGSPVIEEVLQGFNCTIFAYGQTGTGKTFTMEGDSTPNEHGLPSDNAGIVPRSIFYIFDRLKRMNCEYTVRVSYLEIYQEEISDLLNPDETAKNLRVFDEGRRNAQTPGGGSGGGNVQVERLEELPVSSPKDAIDLMQQALKRRRTAETLMNARSSRSHCIFTMTVMMKEITNDGLEVIKIGKLNLVDLAGSENVQRSGAQGTKAKEAGMINQSLLTLGRVINALVDHNSYVPYRDSKLTRLLQDSLGGKTKTCIIATISPTASNLEETQSTLDYASRAKSIKNQPEQNQKVAQRTALKEMSSEIERLQQELIMSREKNGVHLSFEKFTQMENELAQLQDKLSVAEQELAEYKETYQAKIDAYEENDVNNRRRAEQVVEFVADSLKAIKEKHEAVRAVSLQTSSAVAGILEESGAGIMQFAETVSDSAVHAEQSLGPILSTAADQADEASKVIKAEVSSSVAALGGLQTLSQTFATNTEETAAAVREAMTERVSVMQDMLELFADHTVSTTKTGIEDLANRHGEVRRIARSKEEDIVGGIKAELTSKVDSLEAKVESMAAAQLQQMEQMQQMMLSMFAACKQQLNESLTAVKYEVATVRHQLNEDLTSKVREAFREVDNSRQQVQNQGELILKNINIATRDCIDSCKEEVTGIMTSIDDVNKTYMDTAVRFAAETDKVRSHVSAALDQVSVAADTSVAAMEKTTSEVQGFIGTTLKQVAEDAKNVSEKIWSETKTSVIDSVMVLTRAVDAKVNDLGNAAVETCAFAHDSCAEIIKNSLTMSNMPFIPSPMKVSKFEANADLVTPNIAAGRAAPLFPRAAPPAVVAGFSVEDESTPTPMGHDSDPHVDPCPPPMISTAASNSAPPVFNNHSDVHQQIVDVILDVDEDEMDVSPPIQMTSPTMTMRKPLPPPTHSASSNLPPTMPKSPTMTAPYRVPTPTSDDHPTTSTMPPAATSTIPSTFRPATRLASTTTTGTSGVTPARSKTPLRTAGGLTTSATPRGAGMIPRTGAALKRAATPTKGF